MSKKNNSESYNINGKKSNRNVKRKNLFQLLKSIGKRPKSLNNKRVQTNKINLNATYKISIPTIYHSFS